MATLFKGVDVDSIVPLTMQQVYDNALNGVVRQGCFSSLFGKGCFYNHPENPNVHCGIGHSIPPDWRVGEEHVLYLLYDDDRVAKLFLGLPERFLSDTQATHDTARRRGKSMDEFKKDMKKLAKKYRLTYTEPAT